jgi:hypothetical protein
MQSNNHVGLDEITLFLKRDHRDGGGGNCLVKINKETLMPSDPITIFDENELFANPTAVECPTFSMVDPYIVRWVSAGAFIELDTRKVDGTRLLVNEDADVIFSAREILGDDRLILQAQVVDGTDRWYAATLKRRSEIDGKYRTQGIFLYDRQTDQHLVLGPFDDAECNLDLSGKWLIVRHHDYEPPSGLGGGVNRIYNLENGIGGVLESEKLLEDIDGAGGHMDMGHEFFCTKNNWRNPEQIGGRNKTEIQDFRTEDYSGQDGVGGIGKLIGETAYSGGNVLNHPSWRHGKPREVVPLEDQYVVGSGANLNVDEDGNHYPLSNEILALSCDGGNRFLACAPVMCDTTQGAGGETYNRLPKAFVDVTGEFVFWSANRGTDQFDIYCVKIPYHKIVPSN